MNKRNDYLHKRLNKKRNIGKGSLFVLFIPIIAGILVAFIGFYSYFGYQPINKTDLIKVTGTLEDWNYKRVTRHNYQFEIKLREYPATFYIWSVPLRAFDRQKFRETEKYGNRINIQILESNEYKLKTINGKVKAYGVFSPNNEYLSLEEFNIEENSNAKMGLILAFVFVFLTIILLVVFFTSLSAFKGKMKFMKRYK